MIKTVKQRKFIENYKKELLKPNSTKSLGKVMIESGYSPKSAINPHSVMNNPVIKESLEDIIASLDDVRRRAITEITPKKLKKSTAKDNASIADIMIKNRQLLSGNNTENLSIRVEISEEIAKKNVK